MPGYHASLGVGKGKPIEMCTDMCVDMSMDICIEAYADMRVDMGMDTGLAVCRHARKCVPVGAAARKDRRVKRHGLGRHGAAESAPQQL